MLQFRTLTNNQFKLYNYEKTTDFNRNYFIWV